MSAKKVTRKELLKAPDEFLTFSEKAYNYISEHARHFIIGIITVLVLVVLVIGIQWYRQNRRTQAVAAYNDALKMIPSAENNDVPKLETAAAVMEQVAQKYSTLATGRAALLELGWLQYRLGNYDQALLSYQKFLDNMKDEERHLKPLVLNSMGYALEAAGELEKAAATWKDIETLPGDFLKEEALLCLGRVYSGLNRPEEAKKSYQELLEKYPNTGSAELAKIKLASMGN